MIQALKYRSANGAEVDQQHGSQINGHPLLKQEEGTQRIIKLYSEVWAQTTQTDGSLTGAPSLNWVMLLTPRSLQFPRYNNRTLLISLFVCYYLLTASKWKTACHATKIEMKMFHCWTYLLLLLFFCVPNHWHQVTTLVRPCQSHNNL